MTDEEAHRLRQEKRAVTARLDAVSLDSYRLERVDGRLYAYVCMVKNNPEEHCVWEQLAVERFLRMVKRYGINVKAVQRFYVFYENLFFPGKQGMQHYRLTPVQCFQFASVYGFWQKGRRVVREVRSISGSEVWSVVSSSGVSCSCFICRVTEACASRWILNTG